VAVERFDDGTQLVTDATGRVLYYTDTAGNAYGPDTSVVNQLVNTVFTGINAAIQRGFAPNTLPPTPAPAAPQLGGLLLLVAAGVGLFLLLKD
jgi:hypothetical protein